VKVGCTLPQMGPIAAETAGIKRFATEAAAPLPDPATPAPMYRALPRPRPEAP
jgi:hypothetical protein